jgi:putative peptide maturation system protein
MTTNMSSVLLADSLDFLTAVARDAGDPQDARGRLRNLRDRHPDIRMRLLWQREQYDGTLHYDLLITPPDSGTVSLSYCPDRALPWSLRGGHRATERLLLRVNGVSMELDHAIACLDFLWDEAPLAERLVTACLLWQELEEQPVELSDDELQDAMDAFRRARGLLSAEATSEWMTRHCLSHRNLEELVAGETAVARLRNRETAAKVPAYFEQHRRGLDSASIARLVFPCRPDAERVIEEIHTGDDFHLAAERSWAEKRISTSNGFFLLVRRDEFAPGVASQVFDAPPGATLGPFEVDDGYALIRVLAVEHAVLNKTTKDLIERRLFAEWLERRRRSAEVEWFWGNRARTARDTAEAATPGGWAV